MTELVLTSTGTPNTCCNCGKMQKTKWYAENEDMARSGQGKCPSCAKPKPKKKTAPKKTVPENDQSKPAEDTAPQATE